MRYMDMMYAVVIYLVVGMFTMIANILSMVTFPVWYWWMQEIRRVVYTYEGKEVLGVDMSATEGVGVREWMRIEGLTAGYRPVKNAKMWYWIAKPLWWMMKDDGFDAGAENWAYSIWGDKGLSPNGQLPVISGCWRRIGEASDAYVVTDRLRHMIAVFRYTAMRNGAWNIRDYGTALTEVSDKHTVIGNVCGRYGTQLVQFTGDGKPRFRLDWRGVVLGYEVYMNAGWQYGGAKRWTTVLHVKKV